MTNWQQTHKFGGSSLAEPAMFERVANILDDREETPSVVIVSAMEGVTDSLLELVEQASHRDNAYRSSLQRFRETQLSYIENLLPGERSETLRREFSDHFRDIEEVLRALWLMNAPSQEARDLVSGYGEIWSAQLLAGYLASQGKKADWLNTRDALVVSHDDLGPVVDWDKTRKNVEQWLETRDLEHLVVTGFIATTPDNRPTTLGRNGSDFTASIFATLLETDELHIWTDVDGVMSANPGQVPDARQLDELSYQEAMELAYFGASILHPRTMSPVIQSNTSIYIRNTYNPQFQGTKIHPTSEQESLVKGFATVEDMALINLEGSGMVGVPGIASRLFTALQRANVSVVMISQASSEHSICFAVPQHHAEEAKDAVEDAFFAERHQGQIESVSVEKNCSILAAVGDGMAGTPGIAGKFFDSLAKAGVNIKAIAQGSSERNISAVIDSDDETQAIRAAHSGFYLSSQTLSIGIIGPGNVGSTLVDQLSEEIERLREDHMIDLRLRGLINGSNMLIDESELDLSEWRDDLEDAETAKLSKFVDHIQTDYHPHSILIDCTASSHISDQYEKWLDRGIHIVTPNKKANSGPQEYYEKLQKICDEKQTQYLYETTVCAGLPVLQTLENLRETGDEILEIVGVFSGTLSYLFNSFEDDRPFSDVLSEAYERGYTEPDPRDDLSGMDVARKAVIIGREMGLDLELDDVDLQSLVPEDLRDCDVETFMQELEQHDEMFESYKREAQEAGEVLRFVARVDRENGASVGLESYPEDHTFARIDRTDNIVQFRTRRYRENPLVIQGPGAGPDVTAAGVFADILRLTQTVGQLE